MPAPVTPILGPAEIDQLRATLADYTVAGVDELLGPVGRAAQSRGDLAGTARALRQRRGPGGRALRTLVELFVLGRDVDDADARAALHPLPLEAAGAAGLLATDGATVRALLDVRPYAEATPGGAAAADWWVVSDLGSDVRPGPLPRDHVLGVGAASTTLAQIVPRQPVGRALDLGTGCGVQALHLGRHAAQVVATDRSTRALRYAATTAALSGLDAELRLGSLLEPVAGEQFDLVVANPPFVVSPGGAGYDYRDSGLAGDAVCERLLRDVPGRLAPGGTAVLLANWIVPRDGLWTDRLAGWLADGDCDAWVWQREVADLGEYVTLWLRDAGETPGTARWDERYDTWTAWLDGNEVAAIGMGVVALWRPDPALATRAPIRVFEDVPQPLDVPVGAELPRWIARQRWLAATDDAALLTARLRPAAGLVRTSDDVLAPMGWRQVAARLRQSHGMRWEVEVDEAMAGFVAGCTGAQPTGVSLALLAAAGGAPAEDVIAAALPVVRDLVGRGFLIPETADPETADPEAADPDDGSRPGAVRGGRP